MKKIAFIFPGQGNQFVGMGQDFYNKYDSAKKVYQEASEAIDLDLAKLCFEENDLINQTEYTQVALVTTCIAMSMPLLESGLTPSITAGLSLGEYCALWTSGLLDLQNVIKAVRARGQLMQNCVPSNTGSMAVVMGASSSEIQPVIDKYDDVNIANYNSPKQLVISGKKESVNAVCDALKELRIKTVPLNVSGPFHSPFLNPAAEAFAPVLNDLVWAEQKIPYVSNVTAEIVPVGESIDVIKDLLVRQIPSPVLWESSIRTMIADELDCFIEIGPGKALSGFNKKIDRNIKTLSIAAADDVEKVLEIVHGE